MQHGYRFYFLWQPRRVETFTHLFPILGPFVVFIARLSSSMCLSDGPHGNHQLRGAKVWWSERRQTHFKRIWPFFSDGVCEFSVLVKQVSGAGLWLRCSAACLPSVVCELLSDQGAAVTTNWSCDRGLTLQPLLRSNCVSNPLCVGRNTGFLKATR